MREPFILAKRCALSARAPDRVDKPFVRRDGNCGFFHIVWIDACADVERLDGRAIFAYGPDWSFAGSNCFANWLDLAWNDFSSRIIWS